MRTMTFLNGILLSALALSAAAQASPARDLRAFAPVSQALPSNDNFSSTGFVLREETVFAPVTEQTSADARPFTQPVGTGLAILGSREDTQYGRLLHIGLDVEPEAKLPSDFWIRATDLSADVLEPYAPTDGEFSAMKAMTYCYRFVKQYLLQIGEVHTFLPGASAYQAATILPQYGFHRSGRGPANAINNDVCVYSGGNGNNGHIEVKRGGDWWYGYGFIPHSISLTNHRLIACFAK